METLISVGMGVVGAWIVSRLFSAGEQASRRVAVGYFVSPGYRAKTQRQCRSEYSANIAMKAGVARKRVAQ